MGPTLFSFTCAVIHCLYSQQFSCELDTHMNGNLFLCEKLFKPPPIIVSVR